MLDSRLAAKGMAVPAENVFVVVNNSVVMLMAEVEQQPIQFQIGDRLQLQRFPADVPERYVVRVIGSLPGKSLVVTNPTLNGRLILVRPDQKFTVRALEGSAIFAFVSSAIQIYAKPYPHMHLAYPEELEKVVVRNALRANTDVPALVRNTRLPESREHVRSVRMVDLSHTGTRLLSKAPLGAEGEMLMLRFSLNVCGADENIGVLGEIRSMGKRQVKGDALGFWSGIQFKNVNRFQQLVLASYALEQWAGRHLGRGGG